MSKKSKYVQQIHLVKWLKSSDISARDPGDLEDNCMKS